MENIEYRQLTAADFAAGALDGFVRTQQVHWCWRWRQGRLVLEEHPFARRLEGRAAALGRKAGAGSSRARLGLRRFLPGGAGGVCLCPGLPAQRQQRAIPGAAYAPCLPSLTGALA